MARAGRILGVAVSWTVAASLLVLPPVGSASAAPLAKAAGTSKAAKQYKKIVATFDKVADQEKAPATSEVRSVFSSTEKGLSSAHWSGRTAKDMKVLVADLKAVEPVFEAEAKSSNFSPSKKQKAVAQKFLDQITTVRHDLGLAPSQTGL